MGTSQSRKANDAANEVEEGVVYLTYEGYRSWPAEGFRSKYDVFIFHVRYQRYHWIIDKRFSDILSLEKKLKKLFPAEMDRLTKFRPIKHAKMFWNHDDTLLKKRGNLTLRYMQLIFKNNELLMSHPAREFLEIGKTSFHPQLGRKGKEGWLQKSSGGYVTSSAGEFIKTWRTRWFVLHDTYFAYYANDTACEPLGFMQIDQKFEVFWKGRMLTVSNKVRKLTLHAPSLRSASNWFEAFNSFYKMSFRRNFHPLMSTFPQRPSSSVRLYVCGKEYFMSLCIALLQAREEIFIASWMVSPTQLLTRPPLPPLRLDQVLKFKAEQGVRVYVLLYKEVELSGTGNDSLKSKLYLESLSPNIHVNRHPNKLLGSSTAILWSHHEKLVVIDRDLAFAGGIDPCFGRWDDSSHVLTDEDGTLFPGQDYYQPARGLFRPVYFPPAPTDTCATGPESCSVGERYIESQGDGRSEGGGGSDDPRDEEDDGYVGENRDGDSDGDGGGRDSEDAPSVTSSLSCSSYLDDDLFLPTDSVRIRQDSLGQLTAAEVLAISSQGQYESSWGQRGRVARGGHIGPPPPPPPYSLVDPAAVALAPAPGAGAGPQPAVVVGRVVSAVPSRQIQIQSSVIVQSVTVTPSSQQNMAVKTSTTSTSSTSMFSSSETVYVESRPVSAFNVKVEQPQSYSHQQGQYSLQQGQGQGQGQGQYCQTASVSTSSYCSPGGGSSVVSISTRSLYSHNSSASPSLPSSSATIITADDSGTVGDKFSTWLKSFEDKNSKIPNGQLREQYPRMPWHDVHSSVAGLPARDLGAHFVMRWNHHKKSKGTSELRYLTDVSDITHFGVCAKCRLEKIFETLEKCPNCGHDLGPIKRSLNITKDVDLMIPATLEADILKNMPDAHKPKDPRDTDAAVAFITFRCQFKVKMGCRIQGDGPVLVTQITDEVASREGPTTLLSQEGDTYKTDALCAQGLYPMIGDVVTSVNGSSVLHLTTEHLQRFLTLAKKEAELHHMARSASVCSEREAVTVMKRSATVSCADSATRSRMNSKIASASQQYCLAINFRRYYTDDSADILKGDLYYTNMTEMLQTLKDKIQSQVLIRLEEEQKLASDKKLADAAAALLLEAAAVALAIAKTDENEGGEKCGAIMKYGDRCNEPKSDVVQSPVTAEGAASHSSHRHEDDLNISLMDEFDFDDVAANQAKQGAGEEQQQVEEHQKDMSGPMLVNNGYLTRAEDGVLSRASMVTGHSVSALARASLHDSNGKSSGPLPLLEDESLPAPGSSTRLAPKELTARKEYKALHDRFVNYNYLEIRRDLVCRIATSMEVHRMMNEFQALSSTDFGAMFKDLLPAPGALSGTCHVQVLRSVSDWSIGQVVEQSIHSGWVEAIEKAQNFIYIENQFFISSLGGSSIKNVIAKALLDRIVRAVQQNHVFRVIVVVPLHPEGDFVHTSGPRGVLNFQYKTICRGKQSLLEQLGRRLKPLNRDPLEFITFNSLRTHGALQGRLVTEQIYVHDKLLIVDDRVLIMGSANVNDRSMLGDRDSEVALRIEDTVHVTSRMNGKPWSAGALPHAFRKRLMATHLGDTTSDLTDPLCDEVYHDLWLQTARTNTDVYHELDGPASYESCPTIKAYDAAISNKAFLYVDDPLVAKHLRRLRGHLVFWPQNFLSKEVMSFSGSTNAVLPSDLFT